MIVALAGRRIDAPDAPIARFPLRNVELVRERLHGVMRDRGALALVASAACGADLVAQDAARALSLHRVMVLPYPAPVFRERSVTDRPGDWGPLFDELLADAVGGAGDVMELDLPQDPARSYSAYERANEAILSRAMALASGSPGQSVVPVIVWDGVPRAAKDLTAAFAAAARARGLDPLTVSTLE